jgi:uncharacterized protein
MLLALDLINRPDYKSMAHSFHCRMLFILSVWLFMFLVCYLFPVLFYFFLNYSLSYLLYFLLSIPVFKIAFAIVRRAKVLRKKTAFIAQFESARLGCCLCIPAIVVFAGAFNNNHPHIKEISIELPRKSSTIDELKIVFASDFHLGRNDDKVLDRFVAASNNLHPDIVLIGGDLLGGEGSPDLAKLKMRFHGLRARYGAYAILGNHDIRWTGRRFFAWIGSDFFAESGMKLLEDSVEKIGNAFYLAGRKCDPSRKPIEEILKSAPDDLPIILLDHYPPNPEKVSPSRADLQLSGHTHNGQLFPLNILFVPLEYELACGIKAKRNSLFVVTSGLHYSSPPVNTTGFSEILFIRAVFRSGIGPPRVLGAG